MTSFLQTAATYNVPVRVENIRLAQTGSAASLSIAGYTTVFDGNTVLSARISLSKR